MRRGASACLLLALLAVGCTTGDAAGPGLEASPASTVTLYSGRDEELLRPVVEQFEGETGIDVEVRAGEPAELVGALLDEGSAGSADVFYAPSLDELATLARAGRLQPLPAPVLGRVDPRFRAPGGRWMGVSGRVRAAVYNPAVLGEDDLPESVFELTEGSWDGGRLGWAPTDASFRAFVAALEAAVGEEGARAWLTGVLANEPQAFPDDAAIVAAAAAGDIALGLVDHDALYRFLRDDPGAPVANHLFPAGDVGSLVQAAGVGVVAGAPHPDQAEQLVAYLVAEPVQQYFAAEAFEIPLVPGIATVAPLPPVESLAQPAVDPAQLANRAADDLLAELGIS